MGVLGTGRLLLRIDVHTETHGRVGPQPGHLFDRLPHRRDRRTPLAGLHHKRLALLSAQAEQGGGTEDGALPALEGLLGGGRRKGRCHGAARRVRIDGLHLTFFLLASDFPNR